MKNSIYYFIVAAVAIWYFATEGKKAAGTDAANTSVADQVKLGFNSTVKDLFNKAATLAKEPPGSIDHLEYTNGKLPNEALVSNFTGYTGNNFRKVLKKNRGLFVRPGYLEN